MRIILRCAVLVVVMTSLAESAAAQAQTYNLRHIVELLQGQWAGPDILGLIGNDCISFRVSGQNEAALRNAGADETLLAGLRQACYHAASTPRPQTPAARGIVLIEGELPPGWYRVVNELPMSTNRRIDLTPGRTARIVVSAPGWCPARTELTLGAGEEYRWTPALRAKPWVGECT
jgi:hypothetical protein